MLPSVLDSAANDTVESLAAEMTQSALACLHVEDEG